MPWPWTVKQADTKTTAGTTEPADEVLAAQVRSLEAAFMRRGKRIVVVSFDDLMAFALKHDTRTVISPSGNYTLYTGPIAALEQREEIKNDSS